MLKVFIYVLIFMTLFVFYTTNSFIEEPYMDEIFHFPQAMKYYNGSYSEWDPKITTPPGLYLFTVLILRALSKVINVNVATLSCFRFINAIFPVGIIIVTHVILQHLHKKDEQKVSILCSFNIAIFPVLYFFSFLYYTDCGSTFFILLMYYLHLKKFYFLSAVIGAVSLLFRQTNIVWIFYVAAEETLQLLLQSYALGIAKKDEKADVTSFSDLKRVFFPLWKKNWRSLLKPVLEVNCGYVPVALAFLAFVFLNGSIALGDKSAHEVCVHVPQMLYFALFFTCFTAPYMLSPGKLKLFLRFATSNKMLMLELTFSSAICIVFMSHVHPYLLADNRHYTFYIWRRILGRNMFLSVALIPFYLFSGWSILRAIQHLSATSKGVLVFCVAMCVIPQRLLEFRYFIIPYVMVRLHLKVENRWQPFIEFVVHLAMNYFVLHLFLFKRFPMSDEEKEIRIMW